MKKIVSAALLVVAFTLAASAQFPNNPNCTKGHINMPGYACEPPLQGRAASTLIESDTDGSVLTIIRNFITEYNPFQYLN